jgi:glutamyl-tRNA(Gln) amidotransferase subunit E
VKTAVKEIAIRAREATLGVPEETRQALDDGTNGFERILPGADRMYPDTDLPPIPLDDARVRKIRATIPRSPWERQALLLEMGVGPDLAERLSRHRAWGLFLHLTERLGDSGILSADQLASLLLDRSCPRPASLAAAGPWWEMAIEKLLAVEIIPEAVWTSEDGLTPRLDEDQGRDLFRSALEHLPTGGPETGPQREHFVMGHVMKELRGRIPGREIRTWVKEVCA